MSTLKQKKVNLLFDGALYEEMKRLIPAGERSRVVNELVRKELLRIKRVKATERLQQLRAESPKVSTREIVGILKRERYGEERDARICFTI